MAQDAEYYHNLINQGYSSEIALQYTQQYFPHFSLETKEGPSIGGTKSEMHPKGCFIPIKAHSLFKVLLDEHFGQTSEQNQKMNDLIKMFQAIWHHDLHNNLLDLKRLYDRMSPNNSSPKYPRETIVQFLDVFEQTLTDGNWDEISDEEVQEALDGEDVLPISLVVRFDEFRVKRLYKLGERREVVERKSLFGLRKEKFEVKIFENVISVLEFQDEKWFGESKKRQRQKIDGDLSGLHLRLFKDVPHLDLEIIFPNTSPSMRSLDKVKIIAPLVGGVFSLGMKYIPLLFGGASGDTSLSLLGGILAGLGTYMLKTYTTYQKTRENFRKIVAKDMYFKGLANDETVLTYVVDLGEVQEVKEAVLAYVFLFCQTQPISEEMLDEKIESWLEKRFDVYVDFEVDDALRKLDKMRVLITDDAGHLSVVDIDTALNLMDEYWDNLYNF